MAAAMIKVRTDAPEQTVLDRTAFSLLGATTRDNRRRIVELADEKSLTLDAMNNLDPDHIKKMRVELGFVDVGMAKVDERESSWRRRLTWKRCAR